MKRIFLIVLVLAVVCITGGLFLALRTTQKDFSTVLDGKPYVTATIFPIYDIARNIAGDDVNVQLLLPAGASPHTFEMDPRTAHAFANADLVFAIGHGVDDWASQITNTDELVVVDQGITLRTPTEEGVGPEEHEEELIDPHYWLSGQNGKIIATNIANALKTRYPEHAGAFDTRLTAYLTELQAADETVHTIMNEVGNKNIVTLHDAWYYFADAYGLEIIATYTPSAGKDPLPQHLTALADIIRANNIATFYIERQTSAASLQSFLEDEQLQIATLDEIGGLPDTSSYIDLLLYNANVFASQP